MIQLLWILFLGICFYLGMWGLVICIGKLLALTSKTRKLPKLKSLDKLDNIIVEEDD